MSSKQATTYILLGVLLVWLIFGSYHGSITVPADEVKATYKPTVPVTRPQVGAAVGAGDESFDAAYVDTLPTDPLPMQPAEQSNPLEPPRFVPEGSMGTDFGA